MSRQDSRSDDESEEHEPPSSSDARAVTRSDLAVCVKRIEKVEETFEKLNQAETENLRLKVRETELKSEAWKARVLGWAERIAIALGTMVLTYVGTQFAKCSATLSTAPPVTTAQASASPVVVVVPAQPASSSPVAASASPAASVSRTR